MSVENDNYRKIDKWSTIIVSSIITIVIENVLKKKNNNYRKLTGQFLKPWPANMGV